MKKYKCKDEIKNSNIALYMNYPLGSPPLELHISMILDLLERNNKITVYLCNSSLNACEANPFNRKSICQYCKFRVQEGLKFINENIIIRNINLKNVSDKIPNQQIIDSLELGVMSSFASMVKAQNKEQLTEKWKMVYDTMFSDAKKLFNFFIKEIETNNYEYLFFFNGRFADVKPALEAAIFKNINYGIYEVKKSLHELVCINELIHSIEANTRRAFRAFLDDPAKARVEAKKFFTKKENNEDTGDLVYTKEQERGLLPEAIINTDKKVVAVYPTTDDEYKFIGKEWDGYVPEDQVEEIKKLAKSLNKDEYIIVVKMHPNQAHTAENILDRYLSLEKKYSHLIVEPPLSKKDTYALMHRADYIINFASTIGVEACYARKVVIQIGDTTFSRMRIAYIVKSGDEAAHLISKGNLKPKPIRGAIIWGNYLANYNDGLKVFKRVTNGVYTVNGKKIPDSRLLRILQLPAKFEIEKSKPGFKFDASFVLKSFHILKNIIKNRWEVK